MYESRSIYKLFYDIHEFISEFINLLNIIQKNSPEFHISKISIDIGLDHFRLPATFNEFSQRANELQSNLGNEIRLLAQKRRYNISKGNDTVSGNVFKYNQITSYRFDKHFKNQIETLQKSLLDKNKTKFIQYMQTIVDDFDFYDEIENDKYSLNLIFRLLPVLKHIQKQLCCISANIQRILNDAKVDIDKYLNKIEKKYNAYQKNMKSKLEKFISRDVRPAVLVIPCPTCEISPKSGHRVIPSFNEIHDKSFDELFVNMNK